MSFDKSNKVSGSSGTRRKARESALQMLFSVDMAGHNTFSVKNYWGELGFAQADANAEKLITGFIDRLEKFASETNALRPIAKKQDERYLKSASDGLGKAPRSELVESVKTLSAATESLISTFKKYIKDVSTQDSPDTYWIREKLKGLTSTGNRLISNFENLSSGTKGSLASDNQSKFDEFKRQLETVPSELLNKSLPAIETIVTTIGNIRSFADELVNGTLDKLDVVDDRIKTRAEHWRIERMAIVDRNILRLSVYEFLFLDTPHTVVINEALEITRRFSTFEATQFINGILDAIKLDLEKSPKKTETDEQKNEPPRSLASST